MTQNEFVYTTYIKATPETIWNAITNPEFTRQYWQCDIISDWQPGSEWHNVKDGVKSIVGKVLESAPPKRLVLTWAHVDNTADVSQVTFEIETVADMTCLTVTHDQLSVDMASKISMGWPRVLSSLKSFLETGHALDTFAGLNRTCGQKSEAVASS